MRSNKPCEGSHSRPRTSLRHIAGEIAALVAGGLMIALEMWTVVPAPNIVTLSLAVVLPEVTPWAAVACLIAGALAVGLGRGWASIVGGSCAALALGCAIVPWLLLPTTIAACEREMAVGLGPAGFPPPIPGTTALQRPYDLRTAIMGYRATSGFRFRGDLAVPTRDGQRLGLDVYAPLQRGPHPTVVVIYGGAWLFGSRAQSAELATALAKLGYTAIALDYRHAPRYEFPTQINDVRDALSAIANNARVWDVDPQRVAILGRSAGAELALLAAYDPGPLRVRAAIGYYAPIDLVQGFHVPPRPDPDDVRTVLELYLGGPPALRMHAYAAASPIARVRPGLPPTLLIGGGRDEVVRLGFSHEMRSVLRSYGDRVVALDLPWSNHAYDTIANGTAGQIARYYTERFLAATL